MAAHKALENKSFHKGAYIREIIDGDNRWTTNGAIMVREALAVKPLKGQVLADAVLMPVSMSIHIHSSDVEMVTRSEDDEESITLHSETRKHTIQKVYFDYLQAKYDGYYWMLTDKVVVVAAGHTGVARMAVVAPIIKKDKEN